MDKEESEKLHMSAQARADARWFAEKEKYVPRVKGVEERLFDIECIIKTIMDHHKLICDVLNDMNYTINRHGEIIKDLIGQDLSDEKKG